MSLKPNAGTSPAVNAMPKRPAIQQPELSYAEPAEPQQQPGSEEDRIIVESTGGGSDQPVTERVGTPQATVGIGRRRFQDRHLVGPGDLSSSDEPHTVSDDDLIARTLTGVPQGAAQWNARRMAEASGMGVASVNRIWRTYGVEPGDQETYTISDESLCIDRVRDLKGLYLARSVRAVVLSLNESPASEASKPVDSRRPRHLGAPNSRTHHSTSRNSLSTLLKRAVKRVAASHEWSSFFSFLRTLDKAVPEGMEVHLLLDTIGTHEAALIHNWLLRLPHFHLHCAANHASWLSLAAGGLAGTCQSTIGALTEALTRCVKSPNHLFMWPQPIVPESESTRRE